MAFLKKGSTIRNRNQAALFLTQDHLYHSAHPQALIVEVDASESGVEAVLSQGFVKSQNSTLSPSILFPAKWNLYIGNFELLALKRVPLAGVGS